MLLVLALFVVLAAVSPFIGADSRDGLDWTRNHFWLRRRTALRTSDSRAPASAVRGAADGCRTAPAAG
jgi:hypothetical protein